MLYTGKGDKGTTKTLTSDKRLPKNHSIIEALGAVDELNSWVAYCRAITAQQKKFDIENIPAILFEVQESLFSIQGILAGAKLPFSQEKITRLETIINTIEKQLKPIKSFLIPGESVTGALFDVGRTITRRAERRVIAARQEGEIADEVIAYLNRLSSLLYAFARFSANLENVIESAPRYL